MKVEFFCALALLLVSGCANRSEQQLTQDRTPYQLALFSPGQKFGTLPPAVQNTVRAQVGTTEITDIVKDTKSAEPVYIVHFRKSAIFPPLYIAADGSVLNPDHTIAVNAYHENVGGAATNAVSSLKLSDLPPDVVRRIQEKAPNTEVALIAKETWGERAVYVVSFKDPAHYPKLFVAADGTVLTEGAR